MIRDSRFVIGDSRFGRVFILVVFFISVGCEPQLTDDPIPLISFNDVVLNLSLPAYSALRNDGGMAYCDGGIRGLIVYRVNSVTFHAYERNCSYHPNDAGSTVNIDASNLFLKDYSCGSQFSKEEASPTGGPAWRPLRRYHADVSGSFLTITSEVIN